jgi:C4-type Zn-finger protein
MSPGPLRCPFCADVVTATASVHDYPYLRSMIVVHLEDCPKRPKDLTDEEKVLAADVAIEKYLNRPPDE